MDRWESPYKEDGRTTKRWCHGWTGVYFIRRKETGKVTYIGMSRSCLYAALYRHFQRWEYRHFRKVTYHTSRKDYEVRVMYVPRSWVEYVELRLIRYMTPVDNLEKGTHVEDVMKLRPGCVSEYTEIEEEDLPF